MGNWTAVSTSSTYLLTNPASLPNYWTTVRLTVTDANSQKSFAFWEVKVVDCPERNGGATEDRSAAIEGATLRPISIAPNPAEDFLVVSGLSTGDLIQIFDPNGRLCQTSTASHETVRLDVTALPTGAYILSVKSGTSRHFSPFKSRFVKL